MINFQLHLEAIIFSSNKPVKKVEILETYLKLTETVLEEADLEKHIANITAKYSEEAFAFQLIHSGTGYQFVTKDDYHETVSAFLNQKTKRRLSTAALETLSIIAYKQPISKSEMEHIRGVSCDYAVTKLLEKELVSIAGRSDAPGRPLLYATSETFMDYFGINSVEDLPKLKDISSVANAIGEPEKNSDSPESAPKSEASTEESTTNTEQTENQLPTI